MNQAKKSPPRRALESARLAANELFSASSEDEFERHWSAFVTHLDCVWSKACGHYRIHGSWSNWHKPYLDQRKRDPLLQYLEQSRHSVIHRVDEVAYLQRGSLRIEPLSPGGFVFIDHLKITGHKIEAKGNNIFKLVNVPTGFVLRAALNKNQVYAVPTEHLGKPLPNQHAHTIANCAISYYDGFLTAAEIKFGR